MQSEDNDFPYRYRYIQFNKDQFIKDLKEFKPIKVPHYFRNELVKHNPGIRYSLLIFESRKKFGYINDMTDIFQEKERIKCAFKGYIPPIEYWNKNKDKIVKMVNKKYGKISLQKLRSTLYKLNTECFLFYTSVVITILRHFKTRKWLDMSAGWGDRLIGAIASGLDLYVGVDPNGALHPNYQKMIQTLEVDESRRSNYQLLKSGFEDAKIGNIKFDTIFTSPPFFDKEVYSTETSDSLVTHSTVDSWTLYFLLFSVYKGWIHLQKNGHYMIYISDSDLGINYVDTMLKFINTCLPGAKQMPSVYYFRKSTIKKPQQIFLWKKTGDTSRIDTSKIKDINHFKAAQIHKVVSMVDDQFIDYYGKIL